jgi:5-formyltetrahydrofolate cyclo-ligase
MMKQDLRKLLLARRKAITPEQRAQYDAALSAHVLAWWEQQPVSSLGVYWPIRGEPDLGAAYLELTRHGVQLALPVVVAADAPLQFVKWIPGAELVADSMKVPVPAPPQIAVDPQALLIPCVGFNQQGTRLGYGGGYYDRTLAIMPRPIAIGIAYSCFFANFAADPHDIALDAMITEVADSPGTPGEPDAASG